MNGSAFGTASGFCAQTANLWQFVGWIVTVVKIVIPAILIILGIIAFGKAVIASDEGEIKSAVSGLIKRFIIAIVIFFIPAIVLALFKGINTTAGVYADAEVCAKCVASPNSCPTSSSIA